MPGRWFSRPQRRRARIVERGVEDRVLSEVKELCPMRMSKYSEAFVRAFVALSGAREALIQAKNPS